MMELRRDRCRYVSADGSIYVPLRAYKAPQVDLVWNEAWVGLI